MKTNPPERYDDERLGRLLALLRAVPQAWVERAKRIPYAITDHEIAELGRKLEADPTFRKSFDVDPVAAAEESGMRRLAAQLRYELKELVALAEQITLAADPHALLAEAAFPAEAAEPLLRTVEASEDVLAKLPEVVAHGRGAPPPRARLLLLLFGSDAAREKIRDAANPR